MRPLRWLAALILLAAAAFYGVAFYPLRDPHPTSKPIHGLMAITGVRIYTAPDAPAIPNGTILIRDGIIAAVGDQLPIPAEATLLTCPGCTATAGFWNAHVHFTQQKWANAEWKPAAQLQHSLEDMLTSRGFTTVIDTGSNLRDTIPLRRRIEHGELLGPRIYTAGGPQYPPHGIPYYLRDTLPKFLLYLMDQPADPAAAARDEQRNLAEGADLLKLFTGSYIAHGNVLPMPIANAQAAAEVAHQHHQLVFAHESNLAGVNVAIDSNVDVLAHAVDTTAGVDDTVLRSIIDHHMAMVPTLKMFATTVTKNPAYLDPITAEVARFHQLGGELLFGTDVGYMTDYDTTDEFTALTHAGLTGPDILRMLTTAPAARFGVSQQKGTIEPGKTADLVLLKADPMQNPQAFTQIQTTIRSGQILWQHP